MHSNLRRRAQFAAGVTALAVAASVLPIAATTVQALPAGTAPAGPAFLVPQSGNSGTTFALNLGPVAQFCPGDAVTADYRWHTFITPLTNDPAPMTYTASGTPNGPVLTGNLRTTTGQQVRAENPGAGDGLVSPLPTELDFASVAFASIPAGEYWVGVACTQQDASFVNQTERYWSTAITITSQAGAGPNNFTWAVGAAAAAPVATALAVGHESLTVSFNPVTGATSYEATAVPTGGGTPVSASGAGSPITIPGLGNGTEYSVTVTATNDVGTSGPSNALVGTPLPPPVQNLVATPDVESVALSWEAPATGPAPTGYGVFWRPAGSPATPDFADVGTSLSHTVTGLPPGVLYEFGVAPIHPAAFIFGQGTFVEAAANAETFINQEIEVTRPPGALIITQVCTEAPGNQEADGAPYTVWDDVTHTGSDPDPDFENYPFPNPPTYPTHCGIDLGTAELVTSGPNAGLYYSAEGQINQVTVAETTDTDPGWTVTGQAEEFTGDDHGDTFGANFLGWEPSVTSTTGTGAYTQVATAGADVAPSTVAAEGLAISRTLASAEAGDGLGIAELDADLSLLIPVEVRNDLYTSTLTFTATSG